MHSTHCKALSGRGKPGCAGDGHTPLARQALMCIWLEVCAKLHPEDLFCSTPFYFKKKSPSTPLLLLHPFKEPAIAVLMILLHRVAWNSDEAHASLQARRLFSLEVSGVSTTPLSGQLKGKDSKRASVLLQRSTDGKPTCVIMNTAAYVFSGHFQMLKTCQQSPVPLSGACLAPLNAACIS